MKTRAGLTRVFSACGDQPPAFERLLTVWVAAGFLAAATGAAARVSPALVVPVSRDYSDLAVHFAGYS